MLPDNLSLDDFSGISYSYKFFPFHCGHKVVSVPWPQISNLSHLYLTVLASTLFLDNPIGFVFLKVVLCMITPALCILEHRFPPFVPTMGQLLLLLPNNISYLGCPLI